MGEEALVRQLFDAGVHFGHETKRWNPKMRSYIFGARSRIHIIDLEQTERRLAAAGEFLETLAAKGERILFVGTKKQARAILKAEAQRAGMPYVVTRWLGGTLTNFQTVKQSLERLKTLRQQQADGVFDRLPKKEAKRRMIQLERLEENCAGLVDMDRLPGCLFIIDTKREHNAVHEANRLGLPIVALCDTNANPELITYPIPGNDDALRSVRLYVSLCVNRIVAGWNRFAPIQPMPAANGQSADAGAAQDTNERQP